MTAGTDTNRRVRPGAYGRDLPNPAPRPPEEVERLERIWALPRGWRILSAVNNNVIGLFYIATALLFFVLAGILALLMRTQLAQPGLDLLGASRYNQFFTMHGTVMMFLFAVPIVEAIAVYLLPSMQASRDLPFPRLSAYAFWAYLVGGLAFFTSLFFGLAPDGGWFMYPPLTSTAYSPGINADFWLLGIGFIEISAIAGAIEIIVGVLKTRAPGQSIDKMPIYAWAMLVFAGMIVVAFPAVILATLLLELERAFGWPFFIAEKGGDPLLWQHLFWFFGHPEVYVIFLPAAGMVSMILPAMAGVPLVGYRLVVMALIGTGVLSFGLWVHHMFTTGLPTLSLGFFSAASMAVAVPTGIQVFSWIATVGAGRMKNATPSWFLFGFLFIFVLGGLTGVMVAMMPYDWQVHDTYFVVAHLHYVLIGGMVFPLFAAFYYWAPIASSRPLSERLGKTAFWLMFVGVNVTFFTMHITGLMGMPRRVYTYIPEVGWGTLNLISTVGAYMIAAGVLVFLVDLALNFRPNIKHSAGNIWRAGTLEWLPTDSYQTRSIPLIRSREPLWDHPGLAGEVEQGRHYLPGAPTGRRETIVTSPVEARPQYLLQLPGPSWASFFAAIMTAAFFLGLTVKLYVPAFVCGGLAVAAVLVWMWDTEPGPTHPPVDIGGGIRLPVHATGPVSHSWWAMIVLLIVAASVFACLVFSYLYLWTVHPTAWPPAGTTKPDLLWPGFAAAAFAGGSGLMLFAGRRLGRAPGAVWTTRLVLLVATPLPALGVAAEVWGWLEAGLRPAGSSYGAIVFTVSALQGFYAAVLVLMCLFALVRSLAGRLDAVRRATFDNTALLYVYAGAQGLVGLLLLHAVPRLME